MAGGLCAGKGLVEQCSGGFLRIKVCLTSAPRPDVLPVTRMRHTCHAQISTESRYVRALIRLNRKHKVPLAR
jgi:hypothetical protein